MPTITQTQLCLFKNSIPAIRKVTGWTMEEFGDKVGVTKQVISLLEREKEKLPSKTLYIAARYVVRDEMSMHPDNKALSNIYKLAFVDSSKLSKEQTEKVCQALAFTTGGLASGLALATILSGVSILLGAALYTILDID